MRIYLAVSKHGLAGIEPRPVVHVRAGAEEANEWNQGERNCENDKQSEDKPARQRLVQCLSEMAQAVTHSDRSAICRRYFDR